MDSKPEFGWLLDTGTLCIGIGSCGRFSLVAYTDPNAIRFSRKLDAELFRQGLRTLGMHLMAKNCNAVEHSWG